MLQKIITITSKICADEEEDNNYHYANTQSILYRIATTIFSLLKILDENEDVICQHNSKKKVTNILHLHILFKMLK